MLRRHSNTIDEPGDRARLRVLVVDDEMLLRWSVGEALRSCGHTVFEASDAAAALRALAQGGIDAVLVEYWSSERDNFPLLEMVGALTPAAVVVLTTACAIEGLKEQAWALGAAALVHKPFDVFGIEPVLQRVCHEVFRAEHGRFRTRSAALLLYQLDSPVLGSSCFTVVRSDG